MPPETPTQNTESNEPFWYVSGEGLSAPITKHPCATFACTEAERLAKLKPGVQFHVLKCVASVKASDIRWINRTPHA